jgi:hypothetical protein
MGFHAMPHALDILAAIVLIYGAGVLTGFNLARRVTGFMLPSKYESRYGVRPARPSRLRSSSGDMDRVLPRKGAVRRRCQDGSLVAALGRWWGSSSPPEPVDSASREQPRSLRQ